LDVAYPDGTAFSGDYFRIGGNPDGTPEFWNVIACVGTWIAVHRIVIKYTKNLSHDFLMGVDFSLRSPVSGMPVGWEDKATQHLEGWSTRWI
jgi:hypothetical protein